MTAPYVLKADWLEHKSEHGGVAVGLGDAIALESSYMEMSLRLGPGRYVVEELDRRPHVVEMVVATRRDPSFGPVVVVGAGGTETELWRDSVLALAPCTHEDALSLIARLRCAPLLHGWRGRPRPTPGRSPTRSSGSPGWPPRGPTCWRSNSIPSASPLPACWPSTH